jgi:RNA polymerase sigma-70 factor (ECF subfamily)
VRRRRASPGTDLDRATEAALRAHAGDLLAYLVRRLDPQDAPDVLSTVLATAWRRRADLPTDPERARMWLFGTARRAAANHRRSRSRADALTERLCDVLRTSPGSAGPDSAGEAVRAAVAQLPARQRELVRLVHWDGFTLAQAAEIAGIRASTARTHYARARSTLESLLGPQLRRSVPEAVAERAGARRGTRDGTTAVV